MAPKPTLEAIALLGEFGFEFVAVDQVGEPTPGRIADRLSEIIAALEDANARGNPAAVRQATEKLKRLQQAIDVWSLLASELEDGPAQAPGPAPVVATRPPPPAPMAPPVAPPQSAAPPPPPMQPPPPPIQAIAPPVQRPAPPMPAAPMAAPPAPAPPVPEYPAPPVPEAPLDVERLELAAAGTQEAFWQTIGQPPANEEKK
jgi:hypothetical protein